MHACIQYLGGCNGARIRFAPQRDWATNAALDSALQLLAGVRAQFATASLSWSDLIVLAGTTALGDSMGTELPFCAGRTDVAEYDGGADYLSVNGDQGVSTAELRAQMALLGLSSRETVALSARLRSPQQLGRLGFVNKTYTPSISRVDNGYFKTLLAESWEPVRSPARRAQFKAAGKDVFMLPTDLSLRWDPEYEAIAQAYAQDNALMLADLAAAWTRLMNIDRFDGPAGSKCPAVAPPAGPAAGSLSAWKVAVITAACTGVVAFVLACVYIKTKYTVQGDGIATGDGYVTMS
jgi:catalase (peroxidase I)